MAPSSSIVHWVAPSSTLLSSCAPVACFLGDVRHVRGLFDCVLTTLISDEQWARLPPHTRH
eukprot:4220845-Pyramimonas_sp.AAC.1